MIKKLLIIATMLCSMEQVNAQVHAVHDDNNTPAIGAIVSDGQGRLVGVTDKDGRYHGGNNGTAHYGVQHFLAAEDAQPGQDAVQLPLTKLTPTCINSRGSDSQWLRMKATFRILQYIDGTHSITKQGEICYFVPLNKSTKAKKYVTAQTVDRLPETILAYDDITLLPDIASNRVFQGDTASATLTDKGQTIGSRIWQEATHTLYTIIDDDAKVVKANLMGLKTANGAFISAYHYGTDSRLLQALHHYTKMYTTMKKVQKKTELVSDVYITEYEYLSAKEASRQQKMYRKNAKNAW